MKIVILDGYTLNPGDLSWEGIQALGEVTYYDRTDVTDIVARCAEAEIVLTNKVPFSKETLEQLPSLRCICVLATGYNIIDTKAAKEQGVVVCNIPSYSTPSVVQATFSLLFAITNRVEHYAEQIASEGRWTSCPDFCYWDTNLIELSGKRMGIYGMGGIGSRVAAVAMAFGMTVITPSQKPQEALPAGVVKVTEEEFWQTSDVISLHCPLTPTTQHLVNANTLSQMKQGAILLNTSRGPVVNEADVADALRSGRLAAFGADVVSREPVLEDNPLLHAPNVFLTPHIAWATREARLRLLAILTDNIKAFLSGTPINVV